jgi:hypothetical protein
VIDPANVPDVANDEALARFILFGSHVRANRTLKPDAFMPHPRRSLSVTRHLLATEAEIVSLGEAVAKARAKTLLGRGDFGAEVCIGLGLKVEADPIHGNPNHANVTAWPDDKPLQKSLAQEIAAVARYVECA